MRRDYIGRDEKKLPSERQGNTGRDYTRRNRERLDKSIRGKTT